MGPLAKTRVALCRQRAPQISRHDAFPCRVACLEDACDSHNPGGLGVAPPSARLLNHTASPLGGNLSGSASRLKTMNLHDPALCVE